MMSGEPSYPCDEGIACGVCGRRFHAPGPGFYTIRCPCGWTWIRCPDCGTARRHQAAFRAHRKICPQSARKLPDPRRKATQFVADLKANVDAWYDGRIDYDAFTARQRTTWEAIRAAGPVVEEPVLRALREEMRSANLDGLAR